MAVAGTTGGMAMTGGAGGTGAVTATGGAGGAAGMGVGMCPGADMPVTMCDVACPPVDATLAMICVQTCCTADNKCGTKNALQMGATCGAAMEDNSMCPDEMIAGQPVPGCCMPDGMECGIVNLLMGNVCTSRTSPGVTLINGGTALSAVNCDGTMPPPAAGMSGGMAGMTGGMGVTGGMMATDAGM